MAADPPSPTRPLERPRLAYPNPVRSTYTLRNCFICYEDENDLDSTDDWVRPCPCTLVAHEHWCAPLRSAGARDIPFSS